MWLHQECHLSNVLGPGILIPQPDCLMREAHCQLNICTFCATNNPVHAREMPSRNASPKKLNRQAHPLIRQAEAFTTTKYFGASHMESLWPMNADLLSGSQLFSSRSSKTSPVRPVHQLVYRISCRHERIGRTVATTGICVFRSNMGGELRALVPSHCCVHFVHLWMFRLSVMPCKHNFRNEMLGRVAAGEQSIDIAHTYATACLLPA